MSTYSNIFNNIRIAICQNRLICLCFFRFIPKDIHDEFSALITQIVQYRIENNILRNDFIDVLLQMKLKSGDKDRLHHVIVHSMSLLSDGTETSGNTMSCVLYEIAENLDAQKKLREEIIAVKKKHCGKITYKVLQDMTYMDCVIKGM